MSGSRVKSADELEVQLRNEFLGDARDRLNSCQCALYAISKEGDRDERSLLTLHHEVHALKSMSASFGFPSIALIANRLADYIVELEEYSERGVSDIQAHLDRLADMVEAGEDLGEKASEVLRGLPQRRSFEIDEIEMRDVDVLVATPSRAVGHGVGRELAACGYRVTFAHGAIEAFGIAATMRPAIVIAAATLDVLSGFDLLRGLAAMDSTRAIRTAILTSFDDDHPELKRLPLDIGIVHLGDLLRDDLGTLLAEFESACAA